MSAASAPTPWYTTPRFRAVALAVIAVVLTAEGLIAVFVRKNDIVIHMKVGAAFLSGDPYRYGQDIYPLGRTMIDVFLAILPAIPTRSVCYTLAVLALFVCYRLWKGMADRGEPAGPEISLAAAVGASVVTLPFLLRDLDECGLQIFLFFFLTVAGYALVRGWAHASGFWLATATMYKVTPGLVLPFLVWKRQWRAAAWVGVFLAVWMLAPAAYLGWDKAWDCHARWWARSTKIAAAKQAYPSQLELEKPQIYNLSFTAMAARYVETYPPGHPLYIDHPAFVQFGNLAPLTAYYAVRGALLALGLVLAVRFWGKWRQTASGGPDLAREWAAVCILCAIVSPVCWKQHLVLIWPAVFLTSRWVLMRGKVFCWQLVALVGAGAVFLLTRNDLVGKQMSLVLLSYKVDTFAVLLLLGMVLTLPTRGRAAGGEAEIAPGAQGVTRAA